MNDLTRRRVKPEKTMSIIDYLEFRLEKRYSTTGYDYSMLSVTTTWDMEYDTTIHYIRSCTSTERPERVGTSWENQIWKKESDKGQNERNVDIERYKSKDTSGEKDPPAIRCWWKETRRV